MKIKLISYTENPEKLIEYCGRVCYDSYDKMTKDSYKKFIKRLIKNKHYSVLEHANATFEIGGVSRALTHQLVRHRHLSFSQQSQRYIKIDKPSFVLPESMSEYGEYFVEVFTKYKNLLDKDVPAEDARFILPNGTSSTIIVSGNFRAWREFLEKRMSSHAQWEIRFMANLIHMELFKIAYHVFGDLKSTIDLKPNGKKLTFEEKEDIVKSYLTKNNLMLINNEDVGFEFTDKVEGQEIDYNDFDAILKEVIFQMVIGELFIEKRGFDNGRYTS